MKRFLIFLIALCLLAPTTMAENEINPRELGRIEANIEFTSSIYSNSEVRQLNHSIYILPPEYQDLEIIADGNYEYSIKEDDYGNKKLEIFWENFRSQNYKIKMKVENSARFDGPKRMMFPYETDMKDMRYLTETNYVKITDEIREKAREITSGSDNGFDAVTRISTWVYENIEYDLSYSDGIYSSDDVYEMRRGTCDEMTNLFMAMTRSIGIPSRYVAGTIYSREGWGYHAWSEVYLGKWVPVDPTWNEIGWNDATHIEFGRFSDGSEVKLTASYISTGDENVEITQPVPSVKVLDSEKIENIFNTNFYTYPDSIGIGESSLLTIKTSSKVSGCLATSLKIHPRVDDSGEPIVSISGEEIISLCPGETKESHFIIKSRDDIDSGYAYYNLADIHTFLGEMNTIDLEIDPMKSDKSELDIILNSQTTEPGKRIAFDIISGSDYKIYSNLPIEGREIVTDKTGDYYIIVASDTGQVVKKEIHVKDNLTFSVGNLEKPEYVNCGEKFNISFTIKNMGENYFEIETEESDELRYIPKKYVEVNDSEKRIPLETKLKDECSGKDQYLKIRINDQILFEKIETRKPFGFIDEILVYIETFINSLYAIFSQIM